MATGFIQDVPLLKLSEPNLNSAIALANLFDELDWTIGGYGLPSPHFIYSFNAFVESFVLNEHIIIPMHDYTHISLSKPLFKRGRPVIDAIVSRGLLHAVQEGPEHLRNDIGRIIYVFEASSSHSLTKDSFKAYAESTQAVSLIECIPNYDLSVLPNSTPLLTLGCGGTPKENEQHFVVLMQRDLAKFTESLIGFANKTPLHPLFPVYALRAQMSAFKRDTHSFEIYKRVADVHKVSVERISKCLGLKQIGIPPLTSILLSRCKSRENVIDQLVKMRDEFSNLRTICSEHERNIRVAKTLRDQVEIIEEFDEYWAALERRKTRQKQRLIYRAWDVLKSGSPIQWGTKIIDEFKDWDVDRVMLNKYKSLMDIFEHARNSKPIQKQLLAIERMFKCNLSDQSWKTYIHAIENIRATLDKNE